MMEGSPLFVGGTIMQLIENIRNFRYIPPTTSEPLEWTILRLTITNQTSRKSVIQLQRLLNEEDKRSKSRKPVVQLRSSLNQPRKISLKPLFNKEILPTENKLISKRTPRNCPHNFINGGWYCIHCCCGYPYVSLCHMFIMAMFYIMFLLLCVLLILSIVLISYYLWLGVFMIIFSLLGVIFSIHLFLCNSKLLKKYNFGLLLCFCFLDCCSCSTKWKCEECKYVTYSSTKPGNHV